MSLDKIAPNYYELVNLWKGLNWASPPNSLDEGELVECNNFNITQRGLQRRRPLGRILSSAKVTIGMIEAVTPNNRYVFFRYGTKLYLNTWDGSTLTGKDDVMMHTADHTWTNGLMTYMTMYDGMCFLTNGTDNNIKVADDLRQSGTLFAKAYEVGLEVPTVKPAPTKGASNSAGITGKYRYKYVYKRNAEAFEVYCDASDATVATITKSGNTITLVITGGTSAATVPLDLTGAANDTLVELVAVINGTAGWSCVQRIDNDPTYNHPDTFKTIYINDFNNIDALGAENKYYPLFNHWTELRGNPSKKSDIYTAGQTYKNKNLESGDGSTTTFTTGLTVSNEYVQAESIIFTYVIGGQEYVGIDDGSGGFEGEYIDSSSTVTYTTGAYSLVFETAPDNNTDVLFTYATSETVTVTVTVPVDTSKQINLIEVYRTHNLLGEDADSTIYLKAGEVVNDGAGTVAFSDTIDDADLTILMEENNTKPPKAEFVKQHKNRLFYLNCPTELNGRNLILFSKSGQGEACPSSNYQYYDQNDGREITGGASFGDYFIIFKKDKFAVIEGDFEAMYYISTGVGCIAPRTIVEFKDKVIFLSEHGWYSFDGVSLIPISSRINLGCEDAGYFVGDKHLNEFTSTIDHFAFYHPYTKRYISFANNTANTYSTAFCGHFIESILSPEQLSETTVTNLVTWTTHTYIAHNNAATTMLLSAAPIRQVDGSIQIWISDQGGEVYQFEEPTGYRDNYGASSNSTITSIISTGWSPLGTQAGVAKTLRALAVSYGSNTSMSTSCKLYTYADFISLANQTDYALVDTLTLAGGSLPPSSYTGAVASPWFNYHLFTEICPTKGTGADWMFRLIHTHNASIVVLDKIGVWFRIEGVRTWTPTRA